MSHRILVLMIFVLSFLISCGDDNSTNYAKSPVITSILPGSGKVGDKISISGTNFGYIQDSSYITFNNVRAVNIISWEEKVIKLTVPYGAKNDKLSVTVNSIKSNEVDFTVIETEPMKPVKIGSQIWMNKNLEVGFYRNGEIIRHVESYQEWIECGKNKEGAWCYFLNDPANGAVYGKLYNWYAVNDPRGLAPEGWHIPNQEEWIMLTENLGGVEYISGKLKETGTAHWEGPNEDATNSSGFSALAGGARYYTGYFYDIRCFGFWWSSTEYNETEAHSRYLNFFRDDLGIYNCNKVLGYSVRCVKD